MDKFDIEKFPDSDAAQRMLSYVSEEFYEKSYVGKWLYQVMGLEWDDAKRIIEEELPKQFFLETATWGLMYHEIKWGLPVRQNLSYEERRRLIGQKMNYRVPMNPFYMEELLGRVAGVDVSIADRNDAGAYGFLAPHPNVFMVSFSGDTRFDIEAAMKMLDEVKQSHTSYIVRIFRNVRQEMYTGVISKVIYRPSAIMDGGTDRCRIVKQELHGGIGIRWKYHCSAGVEGMADAEAVE